MEEETFSLLVRCIICQSINNARKDQSFGQGSRDDGSLTPRCKGNCNDLLQEGTGCFVLKGHELARPGRRITVLRIHRSQKKLALPPQSQVTKLFRTLLLAPSHFQVQV